MVTAQQGNGGPLSGTKVVEIGTSVAAPYATWILAALGADVIKVERPEGDDARHWGPPFWHGAAAIFQAFNRDKRSVIVDLKDPDQLARLRRYLEREADVVLQNLRPGVIDKYGLGPASLVAANARLIYCNIWAYGPKGPLRQQPGYDPLMQAYGGIMSVTGEDGHPPVRVGTSIIDMGTGMWCAIGVLALLQRRAETGRGGVVDASLFETALGWMTYHNAACQATGEAPGKQGSGIRGIAPYQAYACSDGDLMVAAPNDRLFARLAEVLGHPEWTVDSRFRTNPDRAANLAELNAVLGPVFAQNTRATWRERLAAAGVPSAPIQTMAEVLADAQTQALGIVQTSAERGMKMIGLPLAIDHERPPLRNEPPELGEAGLELLGTASE